MALLSRPTVLFGTVFSLLSGIALSQFIIRNLPGFPGDLPFELETGYIGVGESDEVQLFYYFIQSERSPKDDPLVLWLTGGPGCSSFSGLVYEIGPLLFDYASSIVAPKLRLNSYSWTKVANIIFVDAPVGTGFSYATTAEAYNMTDTLSAAQIYSFLRKWLISHPRFQTNPLYIAGDSYSGLIAPIVVDKVTTDNEAGHKPCLNLMGYVLGNPLTDAYKDPDSRIPFAHLKGLLSDELFESTKRNCKGRYSDVDPENVPCRADLQAVAECLYPLDVAQILEPNCRSSSKYKVSSRGQSERPSGPWCRGQDFRYSYIWANDKEVQKALHVREGTIKEWVRCNNSLSYTEDVTSSFGYHRNLTSKHYQVLIYSGDHDMVVPYIGTHSWIKSLGLSVSSKWRPWFVDGQVAGYTMIYSNDAYYLTFATVKGAGHTAPEYKPKQCFQMVERWFAFYPL